MINDILIDSQRRMKAAVENVAREFRALRTGRANIGILDDITVEYYGTQTPLNQLGSLSAPEPQLIVVQVYDRSAIGAIERAILQSDLGLNPNNDGVHVRIPIPPLTEERRGQLAKHVSHLAEEGKTAVRNVRRDANDHVKKLEHEKEISQDEERRAHKQVQDQTDQFCKEIDALAEAKRQELMTI